ncbi:serine hydrolase [bacterium]|nr:serine hydrolase [bacterium]
MRGDIRILAGLALALALGLGACAAAPVTTTATAAAPAAATAPSKWTGRALGASSIVIGDAAAAGFDPAKLDAIGSALEADVASGKIVGATLLVGRGDKVVYEKFAGQSGPDSGAVTDETIFRIYSMTKPIVSVTAMTLVEDGKLSIDDPVSKYLPEYANLTVLQADGSRKPATQPMLVRHLMSHTSGLVYGFVQGNSPIAKLYREAGEERNDITARELARVLAGAPLIAEPGTAWNYSRSTDVLGAVVEVAGGKPLDVLIRERITGPLGMDDTAFVQPKSNESRIFKPKTPFFGFYDPTVAQAMLSGGGGMSSTTEDYLRFVLMLANKGEFRGQRIIRPETLALMTTDMTSPEIRKAGQFFPGPGMGFGLGFSVVQDAATRPEGLGTFSWYGIAGTDFWVDPTNGVFALFMIQDPALTGAYRTRNRKDVYEAFTASAG